jgi:hypothetical protein
MQMRDSQITRTASHAFHGPGVQAAAVDVHASSLPSDQCAIQPLQALTAQVQLSR